MIIVCKQSILLALFGILIAGCYIFKDIEVTEDENTDDEGLLYEEGTYSDSDQNRKESPKSEKSGSSETDASGSEGTGKAEPADAGTPEPTDSDEPESSDTDTEEELTGCRDDELKCGDKCVPNDILNCGYCYHDCTALSHIGGQVKCVHDVCIFTDSSCENGWAHCSQDPDDGCETNITEATNCGECGNDCTKTYKKLCTPEDDGYECATGCPSDAPTLCGNSCVNTDDSPLHCGRCNKQCKFVSGGQPICDDGECGFECNSDYLKCSDGCFPSDDDAHCGDCRNDCTADDEVCDGKGNCVGCLRDRDCTDDDLEYCVGQICKQCDPDKTGSCGVCKSCSTEGVCINFEDNTQDQTGCNGTCQACRHGRCAFARNGTDPGNDCSQKDDGTEPPCPGDSCDGEGNCTQVNPIKCYRDSDEDEFGNPSISAMYCYSCPEKWVDNSVDCYDSNEKAFPGITGFFPEDRGDGSYDYNCDGVEKKYEEGVLGCNLDPPGDPPGCYPISPGPDYSSLPACGESYYSSCDGNCNPISKILKCN